MGLSDSLGTIEAGKTASMVLLEANPLQDIRNAERIVAVISEGRYLDRPTLDHASRELPQVSRAICSLTALLPTLDWDNWRNQGSAASKFPGES